MYTLDHEKLKINPCNAQIGVNTLAMIRVFRVLVKREYMYLVIIKNIFCYSA